MHSKMNARLTALLLLTILLASFITPAFASGADAGQGTHRTLETCGVPAYDGAAFGSAWDHAVVDPPRKAWTHDAISSDEAKALLNRQVLHPQRTGWNLLDAKIASLLNASGASDAYGKLWYAYQWMVENVTYSWAGYSNTNASVAAYNSFTGYNYLSSMTYEDGLKKSISDDMANRTYHILSSKKGVCYDYAIAFAVIARYVGIESYVRTGLFTFENTALGSGHHGWSILVLDGAQYIFDPQRDARNWEQNNRHTGYYFGVSTAKSYRYNPNYYSADVQANPQRDATFLPVTAERGQKAFVHCTVSGYGTVTGTGDNYYTKNTVTLRAVAAEASKFDGWYDEKGTLIGREATLQFVLQGNTVVNARFVDQADIIVHASASGTAEGGGQYDLGLTVKLTAAPEEGKTFTGWFDEQGTMLSSEPVYECPTTVRGVYTYIAMFEGDVFWDVPAGKYFTEPVRWAAEQGIAKGVSQLRFQPDGECTRAQIMTFLWRAVGAPAPENEENPFEDVPDHSYYRDAVLWAQQAGITKGTSADRFSPGQICTRAQAVTFLWRLSGSPLHQYNPFVDVRQSYYYTAVLWAADQGIVKGTSSDRFSPDNPCTKGQILTFLYRQMADESDQGDEPKPEQPSE